MMPSMGTTVRLGPNSGTGDGFRGDFPLQQDLDLPIVVDAEDLGPCHPMFLLRLRLFVDWHLAQGHAVSVISPTDPAIGRHLAEMRVADGLPEGVFGQLPEPRSDTSTVLGVSGLASFHDVEDAAAHATEVLGLRVPALAAWGDAAHMAISELCDNAMEHGKSDFGAYAAADRVIDPQPSFRLVIVDLGIGIPEHIRAQHPEWQDDTAAVSRVLTRGVTGTGDPYRGNGYSEVLDQALGAQLRRAMSSLALDLRSGRGRVGVRLVDEAVRVDLPPPAEPRRGTWVTYEVISIEP
jgi:anti-sigma regulatory factor (Ser/Thr protein kinase)